MNWCWHRKWTTDSNGSFQLEGYIYAAPRVIWSCWSWGRPYTHWRTSPSQLKCLVIKSLGLAQALLVLVLGLALKRVRVQGIEHCVLVLEWSTIVSWCTGPLGVLVARWHVLDPPAWCGVATTTLCGERGDLHPLWRISLVESGIKVTVVTWHSLGGEVKKSPGRDLITGKQYS
jgi:hypothetical protein